MSLRYVSTPTATKPFSNYSQAVEISPGSRILHVAGQVGARLDGTIADSEAEQHELAWTNLLAILAAAGMDHTNLVDCRVFMTNPNSIGLFREVRDRKLKGVKPASTLLIVAGLANPKLVVEISAVAAAP